MSILHGALYKHLKDIRTDGEKTAYEARIPVLMFLISTANLRLRTWHGTKAIMKHTGFSKAPVIEAMNWLESRGAIYNVPKQARSGSESRIHANRKVWQLTGIMQLGETIIDYLFIKDEDRKSVLLEVEDHAPIHVKNLFISLGLIETDGEVGSQNKPNPDLDEIEDDEIGSQDEHKNEQVGSQDKPKIGSQNDTPKELGKLNLVNDELHKKDSMLRVNVFLNSDIQKQLQHIHSLKPIQSQLKESEIVEEAKKHLANSKKKRARNRLYDMVALICFDLKPEEINDAPDVTQKLIGKAKKALRSIDEKPDDDTLADELWLFKKAYKNKFGNIAIPRDSSKLVTHFMSLRGTDANQYHFDNTKPATEDDYALPESAKADSNEEALKEMGILT